MNTENLSTLIIHKLTQDQYNRVVEEGEIDENALYLTPEEIIETPQPDWNQNDETALDYVKNRPFYTEDPVETVFVEETTISNWDTYNGHLDTANTTGFVPELGQEYRVTWNGVEYTCVAYDGSWDLVAIGNDTLADGTNDTGEPFYIDANWIEAVTNDTSSHTFSIGATLYSVVQIDKKYIPDDALIGAPGTDEHSEIFNDYKNNIAGGNYSHAEGSQTYASGSYSHAEGNNTCAIGTASHAEGDYACAAGYTSHAEGLEVAAVGEGAHAEGRGLRDILILTGEKSDITYTLSEANSNIKIGAVIQYKDMSSLVTAYDSSTLTISVDRTLSILTALDAEEAYMYYGGIATNYSSHSEGEQTISSGYASHAEGSRTTASSDSAHAEGDCSEASGYSSHAEGYHTIAIGDYGSHAEGGSTVAYGKQSHAEGSGTIAYGQQSHAEGVGGTTSIYVTGEAGATTYTLSRKDPYLKVGSIIKHDNKLATITAYDPDALTITVDNTLDSSSALNSTYMVAHYDGLAIGAWSHSEGNSTIAFGDMSHAEGGGSIASGRYSHAEGKYTLAASESQHAQGKYNIEDADDVHAHIVGNGTSEDARSNAHTLDWEGNAWFAGDVYVGSTSGTNKDEGSVKLQKEITGTPGQVVVIGDDGGVTTYDVISIEHGGTDATTAEQARKNLGATATVELTQAEYDALESYDENTLYVITDGEGEVTASAEEVQVTLPNSWTNGKVTVNVEGVTGDPNQPIVVDMNLTGTDKDADIAVMEAWGCVNRAYPGVGTITFECYDATPTVAIPLNVVVM